MGMTFDKAINRLENYYDTFCGYSDDGLCGAIYKAVDTMRKYQKLEDYMKRLEKNGQYGTLRKLKIVLGEVDNG